MTSQWSRAASRRHRLLLLVAFGLLGALAACGGDNQLVGDPVSNSAPDTEITSTPPVLGQTSFTVTFFWSGSDPDGEVAGYEWRISDNGTDGVIDRADTLEADLPWRFTIATDSTFVVQADADSFPIDTEDPRQGVRDFRFWQTHTLFVRSIDDEGAVDPTPARVSFTATTLAPTIEIDLPAAISTNSCISGSRVLSYGWSGNDPDNPAGDPDAVRYLLYPVGTAGAPCLTEERFRQTAPIRADDPRWSDWVDYDAPQDAGRVVTLPRQEVGDSFLFAVQARDVAGAVTPTFEWNRNVRHVRIGTDKYPALRVNERFLGGELFYATNRLVSVELASGQPLEFDWSASAVNYAGIIEAYRYGWDVTDPDDPNDPGWAVAWGEGPSWKRAAPRSFSEGTHNFVVQCRDNSGVISRGFYLFSVVQINPIPNQRSLLLIDDWRLDDTPESRALEADWDRRWESFFVGSVPGFQATDIIDAADEPERVSFRTLNDYRGVVWFVGPDVQSYLHTRLAPLSTTQSRYNWLEVYQARVGNLLIVGPAAMNTSIEERTPTLMTPLFLNTPQSGRLGLGSMELPDGTRRNNGTARWPYSAFCIEVLSRVRPPSLDIFGETASVPLRNLDCDMMGRAEVAPAFQTRYPDSSGDVVDLLPSRPRIDVNRSYKFETEEFYNFNPTNRNLAFTLRDCQTAMFLHRSRRAEGLSRTPDELCPPRGSERGTIEGVPVAIASRRYADSKQLLGAEDFVWGFHPLAFEPGGVRSAMLWILRSRWELPVGN